MGGRELRKSVRRWLGGLAGLAMMTTLAAPARAQDDVIYLKQPLFKIPVQLASDKLWQIKELRLFVSTDNGQNWSLVKSADPSQKSFTFRAQGDGEYWFTLAYVDEKGAVEPRDVRSEPPGLRVVLDTKAPSVDLKALPREDGKIGASWRLRDEKLDLSTVMLETKGESESNWREVPAPKMRDGEARWPAGPEAYSIRATIKDRAGNESVAQVEIPAARPSEVATSEKITPDAPLTSGPSLTGPPTNSVAKGRFDDEARNFTVPPAPTGSTPIPRAAPRQMPATATAATPRPQNYDVNRPIFDRNRPDLPADPPNWTSGIQQVGHGSSNPPMMHEARGGSIAASRPTPAADPKTQPPATASKLPWLVGSKQFAIDYSIKNVGPAGVKKVELYATRDGGKTWKLVSEDVDRTPPFDVELSEEGRYGLKVVIMSPTGWQREPKSGEAPQIVVQVDTTPPEAELYQLVPDPTSPTDTLLVRWSSRDPHISPAPVSLYFSERPDGPWWTVKTGLPATGQFSWKIPQGIPPEVYLRLEARDLANNVSRATTPEAIPVDLSRPEAEVIAILPANTTVR